MTFIRYDPLNPEHRALTVQWHCLNPKCGHLFSGKTGKDCLWAWCPRCRASAEVLDEATTLKQLDDGAWEGTHIQLTPAVTKRKTLIWEVGSKYESPGFLGSVQWFSRWRKYSFFPAEGCVFEQVCLREIAEFIEARTREHKEGQTA